MAQKNENIPAAPEGFDDIQDQAPVGVLPPPPEGFDGDEPEMPGILDAAVQGARSGVFGVGQSLDALQGQSVEQAPISPAAAPFGFEDITSPISSGLPKVAYKLTESSPTIAAGVAGAIAGAPMGPAASFVGGTVGSGVGAAAQTLGPIFAQEYAQHGDAELAYERAYKSALSSGAFSAAGWALWPVKFFQGPVKQAVFQLAGVQPGLMVGERASHNVIADRPITQDLGQAAIEGTVLGVTPAIGHQLAATSIRAGKKFFEPKVQSEQILTPEMIQALPEPPEGFEALPEDPSELPPAWPEDPMLPENRPPPVPQPGTIDYAILTNPAMWDTTIGDAYGQEVGSEQGFRAGSQVMGKKGPVLPDEPTPFMIKPFEWVKDRAIKTYLERTAPADVKNPDMVVQAAKARGELQEPGGDLPLQPINENENWGIPGRMPEEAISQIEFNRYDYNFATREQQKMFNGDTSSLLHYIDVYGKDYYLQESFGFKDGRRYISIRDPETGEFIIKDRDIGGDFWDPNWQKEQSKGPNVKTMIPGPKMGPMLEAKQYIERKARGERLAGKVVPFQNGLSQMRRAVMGPEKDSPDNVEMSTSHIDDVLEVGAIVRPQLDSMNARSKMRKGIEEENWQLEDSLPKYTYADPYDRRILSAAELETDVALKGNTSVRPEIYRVYPEQLDSSKITADLFDLPEYMGDPRVKSPALPGENDPFNLVNGNISRVAAERAAFWTDMIKSRVTNYARAQQMYEQLMDQGYRVVPSKGKGFIYGGSVKLDPMSKMSDIPTTRSEMMFEPAANGRLVAMPAPLGIGKQRGRPVRQIALDWALVPKDTFVSFAPADLNKMIVPKGKEALGRQLKTAIERAPTLLGTDPTFNLSSFFDLVQKAFDEGVYIPFEHGTTRRVEPSEYAFQVKALPENARVPAYAAVDRLGRMAAKWSDPKESDLALGYKSWAGIRTQEMLDRGTAVWKIVDDARPFLDSIVKRLGGKSKFRIVLEEGVYVESPRVWIEPIDGVAEILMPVDFFFNSADIDNPNLSWDKMSAGVNRTTMIAGDLKASVLEVLKHELGHAITLNTFHKLPTSLQDGIHKAYYRALLDYEIRQDLSTMETVFKETNYQYHHMTFTEWMAEQFRRWTHTDSKALTDMDRYFKEGTRSILELQKYFADKYGPDHARQKFTSNWAFNQWMDYLEYAARNGQSILQLKKMSEKLEVEYPLPQDVADAYTAVRAVLQQFKDLIPRDTKIEVAPRAGFQGDGIAFGSLDRDANVLRVMVGSLAWLKTNSDMGPIAQRVVAHEAFHAVEGALTPVEISLLSARAKADNVLSKSEAQSYRAYALDKYKKAGLEGQELEAAVERYVNSEYMAAMVDSRAAGKSFDSRIDALLDYFIQFFERVGNMMRGYGFKNAEDIVHAFYRGELTRRRNETISKAQSDQRFAQRVEQHAKRDITGLDPVPSQRFQNIFGTFVEDGTDRDFYFYDETGERIGYIRTEKIGDEFSIGMIENTGGRKYAGLAVDMLKYAQEKNGRAFRAAQVETRAGYKMLQRLAPEMVKYYVWDDFHNYWYSPKYVWENLNRSKRLQSIASRPEVYEDQVQRYSRLASKIPAEAVNDPILDKQWMMREYEMNEWRKSADIRTGQLAQGVTGDPMGYPTQDSYTQARLDAEAVAEEINSKATGYQYGAAEQPEALMMRKIGKGFQKHDPEVGKLLNGSLASQADKIAKGLKWWYSIRQLSWKNPHIKQLQDYISFADQQNQRRMEWVSRADETLRSWEKLPEKQRRALTDLLYWASDMNYRSNQEVAQGVVRQPTLQEIQGKAKVLGIEQEGLLQYAKITKDFNDFLTRMEEVLAAKLMRRQPDPAKVKPALDRLRADMAALRKRPDFPMMRFGEWTLTGRDPETGEVTWFSAYQSQKDRALDVKRVHNKFNGVVDLRIGRVPDYVTEFMGMPQPLLDRIVSDFGDGLDASQLDWIGRFAKMNLADPSIKRRSLERKGTPGYSMDSMRTYAHYFRHASQYLARIEFKDQFTSTIDALDKTIPLMQDSDKRQIIADMVKEHYEFMNKPGKEWINLKAFTTHFQLGSSVAAAFTNLTQVPVVTYPYLSKLFGEKAIASMMKNMLSSGKRTWDYTGKNVDPQFLIAREEVIKQGKIDTGQAAELGSFAESSRFEALRPGTQGQKFWRYFTYANMYMFHHAERFNREWTFKAAFDLALKDKNNKHVHDITIARSAEHADIMARTGLDWDHAAALLVAREAIDRTQGVYQQWDRPGFLRPGKGFGSQVMPSMQIFFSFTQQTMFQLFNNPGGMKMLMMMGLLYGLSGLPGAEDIDNAIRLLSRKLFGKDFSILHFTRERMNELTKGTIFDQVGADLAINGISRYSYGAGLFADGYMPQFDASASGSFGQLVPGATPLLRGLSNAGTDKNAWKDISAEVLKDVAGPGFGIGFVLLQYLSSPPYSDESKKWEALLPRALKGTVKAYRYATTGNEISSTGAKIAQFDWNDPEDRATIIAQALGFTPRKLSEGYETFAEYKSQEAFYNARKLDVLMQFDRFAQSRDKDMLRLAQEAVKRFNNDMKTEGHPELQISGDTIKKSLQARARARGMTEKQLPGQKKMIPLSREIRDQWRGLKEVETKIVK
jgi:hypothetical protein